MIATPDQFDETEAFQTLQAQVGRKSPRIPAGVLVRQVMRCVPASEWPTRVAATDALLRRLDSARRDELRIETRPEGGRLLGPYTTRRRGEGVRPYLTVVTSVDPIEGRCDCPDFVKNSLGVCKHVLAVLEVLYARPGRLKLALREQEKLALSEAAAGLVWDPVRPLTGLGDWLERVAWRGPTAVKGPVSVRRARALKRFRPTPGGPAALGRTFPDDPAKRLALVEDLLALLPAPGRASQRDPALRALLANERQRLSRVVERAPTPAEVRAALKGLKRSLYPYQREGVRRFLAAGRLLLADDMGLGKTAQAIASVDALWRTGRARRALIIAPASLKSQWAREWASFTDLPARVVEGSPSERQAVYAPRAEGVFIINYEQLLRDLDVIRRWDPDLVVLDEAQRIKNWATKTALSVKGLTPPYRLVLTGTPMENRVEELASVVEWVDDTAMEPKWRLPALHAVRADGRHEVVGVRHLDTLRERLRPCMVRRVRQDVLSQLPPRTDTRVPVEMTGPQQEEHDALIQPIAQILQRSKTRPLTQAEFLRLMSLLTTQRIISNGLGQLRFKSVWPAVRSRPPDEGVIQTLSAPKLLELRQLVRQLVLGQARKVVVFSQWRRMLTLAHWAVSDLLAVEGLRSGFFTGAEGQKRRTQNIVEFHDDPDFRVLFASDAGGVGLNLQRASNCVINLELPWNPAVLEQRIGRVYRIGQDQPIDVFNLISEQGIESRIAGLVGAKQALFKGLFDGDSDSVRFEQSGSFLARVERIYGPEAGQTLTPTDIEFAGAFDPPEAEDHVDDEDTDPFEGLVEAGEDRLEPTSEQAATPSDPAPGAPFRSHDSAEVLNLFSRLQVRRQDDGRVIIEAPADAASALGALFEGMAALLRSVAAPEDGLGPTRAGGR